MHVKITPPVRAATRPSCHRSLPLAPTALSPTRAAHLFHQTRYHHRADASKAEGRIWQDRYGTAINLNGIWHLASGIWHIGCVMDHYAVRYSTSATRNQHPSRLYRVFLLNYPLPRPIQVEVAQLLDTWPCNGLDTLGISAYYTPPRRPGAVAERGRRGMRGLPRPEC